MPRWILVAGALLGLIAGTRPTVGCSLCANLQQVPTFRQEAAQPHARMILYGTFKNPQANGTEFHIAAVLRSDSFIDGKKSFVVPRYIPAKDEKPFLLFAYVFNKEID